MRFEVFVPPAKAPAELIWKARYSTMGLGVEPFDGFEREGQEDWAPQAVPYARTGVSVSAELLLGEGCLTVFSDAKTPQNILNTIEHPRIHGNALVHHQTALKNAKTASDTLGRTETPIAWF